MPIDSLIRLKQLKTQEISGYTVEIIKQYLFSGTGISFSSSGLLTGEFYPLKSNPSGYITGVQSNVVFKNDTGNLVDTSNLAITQATILSQVSNLYYKNTNPSGYLSQSSGDLYYVKLGPSVNTGQLIFDDNIAVGYSIDFKPNKWFYLRGTGTAAIDFYNSSGAIITGFSVNSDKIFLSGKSVLNDPTQFINVNNYSSNTGLTLQDSVKSIYPFSFKQGTTFLLSGIDNSIIDLYDSTRNTNTPYISGFDIYVNGTLFTGQSFSASTGLTFSQLTGASGVLRKDIESIRVGTGNLISKSQTGIFATKSYVSTALTDYIYNGFSGPITFINNNTTFTGPYVGGVSTPIASIGPTGLFFTSLDYKSFIDLLGIWSGNTLGVPMISGMKIDASGLSISGKSVLTQAQGDALYYSVSNPNDYVSTSFVNSQISNLAILEGNTPENTSLYLTDTRGDFPITAFIFDPGAGSPTFFLSGYSTKPAIIDLAGTTSNEEFAYQQPYISGFSITGVPKLYANQIYISGVPISQALSGINTGLLISKVNDTNNTRLALVGTGSNETGFYFEGGNGKFYLKNVFTFPNGAKQNRSSIDLQNSIISNFTFAARDPNGDWNASYPVILGGDFNNTDTNNTLVLNNSDVSETWFRFNTSASNEFWLKGTDDFLTYAKIDLGARTISGFNSIKVNNNEVVTQAQTGTYTGLFYPLHSNPSGYLSSIGSTGYVKTTDTGSFVVTSDTRDLSFAGIVTVGTQFVASGPASFNSDVNINGSNLIVRGGASFSGVVSISGDPVITATKTGILVGKNQTGFFSNEFYPNKSNPSGYIQSSQTGNFTSIFVSQSQTGVYSSTFYPLNTNPSGYLTAGTLGVAYVTTGELRNLIFNTLDVTGILTFRGNNVIDVSQTGAFYPKLGNPSGFLMPSDTGILTNTFVSKTQTGILVGKNETGNFVISSQTGNFITQFQTGILVGKNDTGIYTGSFYPLNSNPSNYVNTTQTGATLVGKNQTGIYSGQFYPLLTNPSGYTLNTNTGILLVGKDQTGIYSGQFYPLVANPSGYLTTLSFNSQTGNFVLTTDSRDLAFNGNVTIGTSLGISGPANFNSDVFLNGSNLIVRSNTVFSGAVTLSGESLVTKSQIANFVTDSSTGNLLVGKNQTGFFVNEFYPYKSNPSGYLTSGNITSYVQNTQTGSFVTTGDGRPLSFSGTVLVGGNAIVTVNQTGNYSNVFYPKNSNPSGYLVSSDLSSYVLNTQTGNFITTGENRPLKLGGIVSFSSGVLISGNSVVTSNMTGGFTTNVQTGNLLVGKDQTGTFKNTFVSYSDTGTFYPISGNPSGYLVASSLTNYIQNTQTGNFVVTGENRKVSFSGIVSFGSGVLISGNPIVTSNQTGLFSSVFYPLNTNPLGYITNSALSGYIQSNQTGIFVTTGSTGIYTNTFYPLKTNPSGYLVSSDLNNYITTSQTGILVGKNETGNFVTSSQTGAFATQTQTGISLVGKNQTGIYTGSFYPLASNPSGYLTTVSFNSQTGNFVLTNDNRDLNFNGNITVGTSLAVSGPSTFNSDVNLFGTNLIVRSNTIFSGAVTLSGESLVTKSQISTFVTDSETGTFLVGKNQTGIFSGSFYPLNSNPSNYVTSGQTGNFVTQSQTGGFVNQTQTGVFVTQSQTGVLLVGKNQTGIFSNQFYPLNSNPSGYITISQTGDYVTHNEPNNVTLNKNLNLTTGYTTQNPANKVILFSDNNYTESNFLQTGSWVLHTNIARDSNTMFRIHVKGFAYGDSAVIDFAVGGYAFNGVSGTIDNNAGAVIHSSISENGTLAINKYIGIDSGGNVSLAFGDYNSASYFYRLWADGAVTNNGALTQTSGWYWTIETGVNLGWVDKTQLSGTQYHNHDAANIVAGTLASGRLNASSYNFNGLSVNNSPVVTQNQTGIYSNSFYPLSSNPSNYVSGSQTGNFVTQNQTGNFITTGQTGIYNNTFATNALTGSLLVGKNQTGNFVTQNQTGSFVTTSQTGIYSNSFYPLNSNPSSYVTSSQTGSFITQNQTGIFVTTSQTGVYNTTFATNVQTGNLLVGKNQTGIYTNTFILNSASGNFVNVSQTGSFVTQGQTGIYTNSFYPLSTNPSGYLISSQTGILVGKNETGQFSNIFYPRVSNPSGYITGVDLTNYVTTGDARTIKLSGAIQIGTSLTVNGPTILNAITSSGFRVITTNDTGNLVGVNQTGFFSNIFYPLNSNPSGYVLSSQTGSFVTSTQTGSYVAAGQTGILVGKNETGVFVTHNEPSDVTFNKNIYLTTGFTRYTPSNATYIFSPNSYSEVNDIATGAWVLHTNIPRNLNCMFRINVKGFAYGDAGNIDFSVGGYAFNGVSGNIDGNVGAVGNEGIIDNSSINLNKYAGIDENGNVAIAFGDTNSTLYFYRVWSEGAIVRNGVDSYLSGWYWTRETGTNFNWKDKTLLTGYQFHNHDASSIAAGALPSGRLSSSAYNVSAFSVNNSPVVTQNQTGNFITSLQTGNFVTQNQTGNFITSAQTGSFITNTQTGNFVTISQTGNFVTTSQTGIYSNTFVTQTQSGLLLVGKNQTGVLTGVFVGRKEGNLYDISGNLSESWNSRRLFSSDGVSAVLDWDVKAVYGTWQAEDITIGGSSVVTQGQTGIYNNSFYPVTGGQVSGPISGRNIVSNKNGFGAGLYTFYKGINATTSANVFSITNLNGAQVFDVMINCSTTAFSVAKSYAVVHQYAAAPISQLKINTGPYLGKDFSVDFLQTGNSSGVAMRINNTSSISGEFAVTLILGACFYNPLIIEF